MQTDISSKRESKAANPNKQYFVLHQFTAAGKKYFCMTLVQLNCRGRLKFPRCQPSFHGSHITVPLEDFMKTHYDLSLKVRFLHINSWVPNNSGAGERCPPGQGKGFPSKQVKPKTAFPTKTHSTLPELTD